jgi:hypothetical protein
MRISFALALLGSVIGTFFLISAVLTANSAPQQAALAAISADFAVLPYVFARCIEKIGGPREIKIVG